MVKVTSIAPELLVKWRDWGLRVGLSTEPIDPKLAQDYGKRLMNWLGRKAGPVVTQPSPLSGWLAVCAIADRQWDGIGEREFPVNKIPKGTPDLVWPYLDGAFWANYAAWVKCLQEAGVTGLPADLDVLMGSLEFGPIWPLEEHCVISDRPKKIVMADGRLHCETGPAVLYRDGFSIWAMNGVRVPAEIVMTRGEDMDADFLRRYLCGTNVNAEIRREVVRKVGAALVIERLGGKVIDRSGDGVYELIMLDIGDARMRPYLKMKNPSIGIWHVEGVHPSCNTVERALAWRNGLDENEIDDKNGADYIQQGDVLLFPVGATKFKRHPREMA